MRRTEAPRTAFLLRGLPYPPVGGAPLRNLHNIEAARHLGPVRIICAEESELETDDEIPDFVRIPVNVKVRSASPGALAFEVLGLVSRRARKAAKKLRRRNKARKRQAVLGPRIRSALEEFAPHVVVFEETFWAPFFPDLSSLGARIVYDAHNVEADLQVEMTRIANGRDDLRVVLRAEAGRQAEARLVALADESWTSSERDRSLMIELHRPPARVRAIPNAIDSGHYRRGAARCESAAPAVLFTGRFSYSPNEEASRFLVRDVMPGVWKAHPDAKLILCGQGPTPGLRKLASEDPRVCVTGLIEDVRPFFEMADVFAVPLLHGGGTRFKILEALAMETPTVSTTKGAEGLEARHEEHLLIADDARAFASQIVRCLEDEQLAARLRGAGRSLVESHYSWRVTQQEVRDALTGLAFFDRRDSER